MRLLISDIYQAHSDLKSYHGEVRSEGGEIRRSQDILFSAGMQRPARVRMQFGRIG